MVDPPESTMFFRYVRDKKKSIVKVYAYLVKATPNIDRRLLDDVVDNIRERGQEVGGVDLRVEEDFRCEETFVTDVDAIFLLQESTWRGMDARK